MAPMSDFPAPGGAPAPRTPRAVEAWPCQSVCVWRATGEVWAPERTDEAPLRVFACAGCGSEWVRTEPWTPIDAHGVVPVEVAAERRSA